MEDKKNKSFGIQYLFKNILVICLALEVLYFVIMCFPLGGVPNIFHTQRKIQEIEHLIENHYLGEVEKQHQADCMFLGLVEGLGDRYSTYYTQEEYAQLKKKQDGVFVGIGITIVQRSEDKKIQVFECIEDSPAAKAGVKSGDVIESVEGKNVTGMSSKQVMELIQKSDNTTITMVLTREGSDASITVEIAKETVKIKFVKGEMLKNQIGYIQITDFTDVTSSQFEKIYEELKEKGLQKLVIDLRDNPGGLLDGVCDTLSQILPEGIIVYTKDKDGNQNKRDCAGRTPIDIPLVILVNEGSASASEIFAGAVKDYGIGTLVGEKTFGKGIVQNTYKLSDGSVVKLTVAHYYTPKGDDINGTGIIPDVEVKEPEESKTDVQLDKALEILTS
ncbi:MAG: S41 family peptidase [Lachnospiraceae bacterium]|nr:S41 family peptidase [Lachnospiraceae bacterium]